VDFSSIGRNKFKQTQAEKLHDCKTSFTLSQTWSSFILQLATTSQWSFTSCHNSLTLFTGNEANYSRKANDMEAYMRRRHAPVLRLHNPPFSPAVSPHAPKHRPR